MKKGDVSGALGSYLETYIDERKCIKERKQQTYREKAINPMYWEHQGLRNHPSNARPQIKNLFLYIESIIYELPHRSLLFQ
jgi:hypothetical protein